MVGHAMLLLGVVLLPLLAAGASLDPLQFALEPPMDAFTSGMPTGDPPLIPLATARAGAFFPDGTLLYSAANELHHYSSDLSTHLDTLSTAVGHAVPHPDGSIVALSTGGDAVLKYTSSSGALTLSASSSDNTACNAPTRAAVQRTGNQRIFVSCAASPQAFCQYDADLSNRACTSLALARGLAIAPDDSFLVVRDSTQLRKYTINDGAGTLSHVGTQSISGGTFTMSLVVLSDFRVVVPDYTSDQLEVVNAAFDTATSIEINDGSTLGGITPTCDGPEMVAVDFAGTGDVVVACESSNTGSTVLILSNDLSTTAVELTPKDLGLIGSSFGFAISTSSAMLNVGDMASGKLFVGGSGQHGFAFLDLTGSGTAGLAGSYDAPLLAPPPSLVDYAVYGASVIALDQAAGGVGVFGDGTVLVAHRDAGTVALLSSDLSTLLDADTGLTRATYLVPHPDGSMIVLDATDDGVRKYTSSGGSLTLSASSTDGASCNGPTRAVVQQTGNQRVFVSCVSTPDAVCQYDADLSNRACTAVTAMLAVGIAPDDSFIVVRDSTTLIKYTINDGAGTLTLGPSLDISGVTFSNVYSLTVLSDHRVLFVDPSNDEIEVVNPAFDTVSTVDVNDGSTLGGITPTCDAPSDIAVDFAGTGDIFVACDTSDSLLILSNDLSTTALEPTISLDTVLPRVAFEPLTSTSKPVLNVADASGTKMAFLLEQGFALLDMTGAGSSGLAGSYGSLLASLVDYGETGVVLTAGARHPAIDDPIGVVDFSDGTLGVVMGGETDALLLTSGDFLTLHDFAVLGENPVHAVRHPDDSVIVLVAKTVASNTISKFTASANALSSTASFSDPSCALPSRAVVQQTGNQRIFVSCFDETDALCQLDADLTNPDCTTYTSMLGVAIAPGDAFLVVRADDTLFKYTINDGAGTLTQIDSFSVAGAVGTYDYYTGTSGVYNLAVLADGRTVFADGDNDELEVVAASFDSMSSIGVASQCAGPSEVVVDSTGAGEVVVLCDDNLLVLSNDLTSSSSVIGSSELGTVAPLDLAATELPAQVGFLSTDELYFGGVGLLRITGAAVAGASGDPIMVDFLGHRFLAGNRPDAEYRLLEYGRDTVTVTTGASRGRETGYFVVAVTLERSGCGSVRIEAVPGKFETMVEADECARLAVALGDSGLAVLSIGNGAGAIAIKPHPSSDGFSFLNTKVVFVSDALRTGCVAGMLCDEGHRDDMFVRV